MIRVKHHLRIQTLYWGWHCDHWEMKKHLNKSSNANCTLSHHTIICQRYHIIWQKNSITHMYCIIIFLIKYIYSFHKSLIWFLEIFQRGRQRSSKLSSLPISYPASSMVKILMQHLDHSGLKITVKNDSFCHIWIPVPLEYHCYVDLDIIKSK